MEPHWQRCGSIDTVACSTPPLHSKHIGIELHQYSLPSRCGASGTLEIEGEMPPVLNEGPYRISRQQLRTLRGDVYVYWQRCRQRVPDAASTSCRRASGTPRCWESASVNRMESCWACSKAKISAKHSSHMKRCARTWRAVPPPQLSRVILHQCPGRRTGFLGRGTIFPGVAQERAKIAAAVPGPAARWAILKVGSDRRLYRRGQLPIEKHQPDVSRCDMAGLPP